MPVVNIETPKGWDKVRHLFNKPSPAVFVHSINEEFAARLPFANGLLPIGILLSESSPFNISLFSGSITRTKKYEQLLDALTDRAKFALGPIAKQRTILFVDDNEDAREMTPLVLERPNYKFIVAANGQEALELYKLHLPDMIVSDVDMPVMNGFELLEAIRLLDKAIPMIMITGNAGVQDYRPLLISKGANAVLKRPVDPDVFASTIESSFSD